MCTAESCTQLNQNHTEQGNAGTHFVQLMERLFHMCADVSVCTTLDNLRVFFPNPDRPSAPVQACWAFHPRTCSTAFCRSSCLCSMYGNATTPRHALIGCKFVVACLRACLHRVPGNLLQSCVLRTAACHLGAPQSLNNLPAFSERCLGVWAPCGLC